LINLAIFNYLICNSDCHAKNISVLYDSGPSPSLAPFYDLVCTGIYPSLSSRLAMGIGGVFNPSDINTKAWEDFAEIAGIRSPKPVLNTLKKMATAITEQAAGIASKMSEQYGANSVFGELVEKITQRAAIALRQVS